MRRKLLTGTFTVTIILLVSFIGSVAYWYALSVMGASSAVDGVWRIILWSMVAMGVASEIVKKVSLSIFRHGGLWIAATFVSVLTVMGTVSILDANREDTLVKQSDQYKAAQSRQKGALDTASQYGWASGFDLASLESQLQQVVDDRAKRRIKYASYLSQKKALEKKIEAKRAYDSAMSMNSLAGEAMAQGGTGANSSNPLLSNIATVTGVGAEALKTGFYLMVTLLLEYAAFFFGGKVEEIRNRLNMTRAQLLDIQNMEVFGISVAQISNATYQNVLQAENDQIEAESEVKKLRKKREKPAYATAENVQSIRAESKQKLNNARQKNSEYSSTGIGFLADKNTPKSKFADKALKTAESSAVKHDSGKSCINMGESCNNMSGKPTNGKAGERVNCPTCGNKFIRKMYNHRFCSAKCRDDFHNEGNEKRLQAKRANLRKIKRGAK